MSSNQQRSRAAIWQGYHHQWEYNHRINRFGSYVRHGVRPDGKLDAVAGHTAASGTGDDTAHFSEYVTRVCAAGVGFQPGCGETLVDCTRAETTAFRIKVDELELDPALVGKDTCTVVLNGFDLYAQHHADKLVSFDLEVTDPTVYAGGTKLRFNILGSMCFDCRTAECQLWPVRLEVEDVRPDRSPPGETSPPHPGPLPHKIRKGIPRHPAIEKGARWVRRQIARLTDLDEIKRSMIGSGTETLRRRLFRVFNKRVFLRLLKWRINTPYVLRVHYLVIAGDAHALRVTESAEIENAYTWDLENEIVREQQGVRPFETEGGDPQHYGLNTYAFKQISVAVALDREFETSDPVQWGRGTHMLEWSVAVRDIQAVKCKVSADLDLFYKCWSEAMNQVITLTTWGALRSAGSARLAARLALLQFADAESVDQLVLAGEIHWPGFGRSAEAHPQARLERPVYTG